MAAPRLPRKSWALLGALLGLGYFLMHPQPAPVAGASGALAAPTAQRVPRTPRAARSGPSAAVEPSLPLWGWVKAEGGAALARATVCLLPPERARGNLPECAASDAGGAFRFEGADAAGALVATAAGYLPVTRHLLGSDRSGPLLLVLQPGGVRVSGSVLDASGGAVVGARVSASSAAGEQAAVAVSDDAGAFQLTLAAGVTLVRAQADGYSEGEREVHAPIADLRLVLSPASVIAGRVLSEDTLEPVPGVSVTLRPLSGFRAPPRLVQSAADGTFRVPNLSAGRYELLAFSQRWRGEERHASVGVADLVDSVELLVRPAARLHASVRVAGEPCTEGSVDLSGPVQLSAALDAGGSATFEGVPPGPYEAAASCQGALDERASFEVGLEPVERAWDLKRGLQLTGLVLSAAGQPAPGAVVQVLPVGQPEGRVNVRCSSDERGEFACSGLAPGDYDCQLGAGSQPRSESVRVRLSGSSAPRVTLRAHALGSLRVKVNNGARFELPALVVLAQRGDEDPQLADPRGDEFVFDQLGLGSYRVWYEATPPPPAQSVQLTHAGQVAELSLTLPPAHELAGRVIDPAGNGVADAWVRAVGGSIYAQVMPPSPVLTDERGAFQLRELLPGSYRLDVTSSQGEAQQEDVHTDRSDVVVRLPPYGSLSVTVIDAARHPVSDFIVAYHRADDGQGQAVHGSRGAWSAQSLPPGGYVVRVTASEGRAQQALEIYPGAERNLLFQLGGAAAQPLPPAAPPEEPELELATPE